MKLTKKVLAVLLATLMVVVAAFAGCSASKGNDDAKDASKSSDAKTVKFGLITLHDENSTYDKNFIAAAQEAAEACGVELVQKNNIEEGQAAYEAAAELVDEGCNLILADSFGHEDYIIQAAKEFTDVQFLHATGTKAHTENLPNYHNAFSAIYEGRFLAGVAAGEKLNQMIADKKITADQAKLGYVGAYTYAEVISGYTSFYLGAKSVCPSATMKVTFTGSWYDETAEKEAAQKLINDGCVVISQHADSMGAPTACEKAGVPNVSYNGSTESACPNTFIVSSRINWAPYYEHCIKAVQEGKEIEADWVGTLADNSVCLTDFGAKATADGTAEAVEKAKKGLEDGTIHVFDTSTFTVTVTKDKNVNAKVDADGHLTSYMADVDTDANYTPDTEAVSDGYFHESEYRAAPYFDIQIDGIELLDTAF
ncbi:BMP family ABC transporter substrate-binding protein [uncultured Eubacterium sp.]|uniref:BMP family ABC transporter substrate-binding protein n=1 Tax=uncultured Eubacterium sp. TaxID=165185 RepID=UPI002805F7BE|nr:BMP family ABC transporter substrate-binding protein [uncultured Eubacterium sp.]